MCFEHVYYSKNKWLLMLQWQDMLLNPVEERLSSNGPMGWIWLCFQQPWKPASRTLDIHPNMHWFSWYTPIAFIKRKWPKVDHIHSWYVTGNSHGYMSSFRTSIVLQIPSGFQILRIALDHYPKLFCQFGMLVTSNLLIHCSLGHSKLLWFAYYTSVYHYSMSLLSSSVLTLW